MGERYIDVPVTQDIIDRASPGSCYFCLIALALREATGLVWHLMPHYAAIEVMSGRKPVWRFPPRVRALMNDFDSRSPVKPTSFKLPKRFADPKWKKLGAAL